MGHKPNQRARKRRRERTARKEEAGRDEIADLRRKIAVASQATQDMYRRWLDNALRVTPAACRAGVIIGSDTLFFEKVPSWCHEAAGLLMHPAHGSCVVSLEIVNAEHGNMLRAHLVGRIHPVT
ncbi:MAG: hypothetical protein AAB554_03180 [Patescibacteria group bacterium]|mgnify:CR=1 FL=1